MKDASEAITDIENFPLCPLCDQPIARYEEIEIVTALGMAAIAHKWCCEDLPESK